MLEDSQEEHALSSHRHPLVSKRSKTQTHKCDGNWKEEEDEGEAREWEGMRGEEEWKSAHKWLFVFGFNPCRVQLSANTLIPQRQWREGKRRRQALWSGGGRRKDEGRWNMWGKNKRKEMKKGRRQREQQQRTKEATKVVRRKARERKKKNEGREAEGQCAAVLLGSADGRAEKCCGRNVSWSLQTKPNQQSLRATHVPVPVCRL